MRIKNPQSALLTNHELLLHLRAEEASYNDNPRRKPPGLAHMLRDGLAYLEAPDYATSALVAAHPNRPLTLYKGPHSVFRALGEKYRLNKAEYLQIYNIRPRTQVALELVVEEAHSRFTEDEMADILAIVQGVFDEEEASIPADVEHVKMDKIANKLLGAKRKKAKGKKRTAAAVAA